MYFTHDNIRPCREIYSKQDVQVRVILVPDLSRLGRITTILKKDSYAPVILLSGRRSMVTIHGTHRQTDSYVLFGARHVLSVFRQSKSALWGRSRVQRPENPKVHTIRVNRRRVGPAKNTDLVHRTDSGKRNAPDDKRGE